MKNKLYRQGDVLIERIESIPTDAKKQKRQRIILAHGEATGHHHSVEEIDAADWWKTDTEQFVHVTKATAIVHQEHDAIALPPGKYRVSRQVEYSPEAIRKVAD